ncbi:hypothetical protein EVA_04656 [gut metagenome]|uniref:Uncharacterized protein n=1 Tax=gut metagenome TaxID=749906 RepID=J9GJ41_9ZZZZ
MLCLSFPEWRWLPFGCQTPGPTENRVGRVSNSVSCSSHQFCQVSSVSRLSARFISFAINVSLSIMMFIPHNPTRHQPSSRSCTVSIVW